ncbi:hypothetical protein ACNHKD_16995 [Methylocystis sp. JAN1]|uniref:hypothetical protein n=1 Tax=Methylocystis sp. JAN1 TaxID=3397211 RepID=UPI003FA28E95
MRKFILAVVIATSALSCFSITSAGAAQRHVAPQDTPIALFKAIYGEYPDGEAADAWHKADKEWLGKGDVSNLPTWETLPLSRDAAALNQRVQKAIGNSGEVCIDFDQISDSQDPNIAAYRIVALPSQTAGRAEYEIYLKGTWRKDIAKVAYVLVEERGKWRVDDIVTSSTDDKRRTVKSAAREMLRNCLKN